MKDLLRITQIDGDVCRVEKNLEDEKEAHLLAAAILGLLAQDKQARAVFLATVATFIEASEKDLEDVMKRAAFSVPNPEHAS